MLHVTINVQGMLLFENYLNSTQLKLRATFLNDIKKKQIRGLRATWYGQNNNYMVTYQNMFCNI